MKRKFSFEGEGIVSLAKKKVFLSEIKIEDEPMISFSPKSACQKALKIKDGERCRITIIKEEI